MGTINLANPCIYTKFQQRDKHQRSSLPPLWQSWALAVFFNLFNYKNYIFYICYLSSKFDWVRNRLQAYSFKEIGTFYLLLIQKIPKVPSSALWWKCVKAVLPIGILRCCFSKNSNSERFGVQPMMLFFHLIKVFKSIQRQRSFNKRAS